MDMKCPMCGGTEFDEPRTLRGAAGVNIFYKIGASLGALHFGNPLVKGRACLHCGFLALMVDPVKLHEKRG